MWNELLEDSAAKGLAKLEQLTKVFNASKKVCLRLYSKPLEEDSNYHNFMARN